MKLHWKPSMPRLASALLGIAALTSALFSSAVLAAPTQVLITLPTGVSPPLDYTSQLAAWRQSGEVVSVLLLEQDKNANLELARAKAAEGSKVIIPGFSSLAVVEFASEHSYASWRDNEAKKLAPGLVVKQADVMAHGELTPRDSNKSIFQINVYDTLVSPAQYQQYVTDYIKPNMENQRAAKVLIRYSMYLERAANGGRGKSTLVMEYRNAVAYDRKNAIKDAFKAQQIAANGEWKRINDSKETIRTDYAETMADYVELPPPQLPDLPSYKPEFNVVGDLRMVGSELKNAVVQLAEGFSEFHPQAKLSVSHAPSSEGGIAALYLHVSDVAPMGDDAKITDMMPFWNTFGYMPTEISVATGGYEKRGSLWAWAIVVSKDNPLNEISVDELKRVFGAERSGGWEAVANDYRYTAKYARGPETNIRTWGQLGLGGAYAKREIETFGYSAPGFATYFERNWFHWSKKWNPNFMEYVEAKQTSPDAEGAQVSSTVPLEQLGKNKYAIGIAGLMHVKNYPDVKVLKISEAKGGQAIELTPDNVANRVYPLIRDGYFYINKAPGQKLDPKVREFMRFVLSREGQEIIARVGYYYPLNADRLNEQLKKLD